MMESLFYYLECAWYWLITAIDEIVWFAQQSPILAILAVIILGLLCKIWVVKRKQTIY